MLCITTQTDTFNWWVGCPKPAPHTQLNNIVELQADGDELEMILRICQNIPTTDRPVQRWFGDHAKFIAWNANLINIEA